MDINLLLQERNISKYKLAKLSNVPLTTISDLSLKKSKIENCSVITLYKIAKVLNLRIEDFINDEIDHAQERISFDNFKSNLSHDLKNKGDIKFIIDTLKNNDIRNYFDKKWYPECFYLLASIDYLSRINNIPLVNDFDYLRTLKLNETLYPSSILIYDDILKTNKMKKKAMKEAIPEFLRFNIVEGNIKDAV